MQKKTWTQTTGIGLVLLGLVLLILGGREIPWPGTYAQTSQPTTQRITHATSRPMRSRSQHLRLFQGPMPGMPKHPVALARRLAVAYRAKGSGYKPRTHHFLANKLPKYHNRLLLETSPYLLQHAHNPVSWYAWGDEAFARARKENKPVFLSVGYSTCHWCHVMEKESFENEQIAAYLNKHYIAIKVDREERLDVDGIYMKAVQIFSRGGGGWPMSVWLTPNRRPFFAGTYFPPKDRWGRRGFLRVLKDLRERFQKHPLQVASRAYQVAQHIRTMSQAPPTPGVPTSKILHRANQLYQRLFDSLNGGTRGRPKFPSSFGNAFLLRYYRRTGDKKALQMVVKTLQKMAYGGIYDQVAGGFHRYSTDAHWLVPHFEKMLYDNALLAALYAEGYQVIRRPLFARITHETFAYVAREMTAPGGAFYSATDADSEGHEGKYFVWKPQELDRILGQPLSRQMKVFWGITLGPNFEGKNILYMPRSLAATAQLLKLTPAQLRAAVKKAKKLLYQARKKRVPPLLDTKIITSWNGLMISAFARAAQVFQRKEYTQRAARAATFILTHLRKRGRLFRTYKDGRARHNAYLEDYAFLIAGLLDLFEATRDMRWFQEALALQKVLQQYYWDQKHGGYFRTSTDHESLIVRPKPNYDGAIPTGNSVQAMNLLRLYTWTTKASYRKLAEKTFQYFGSRLKRWPLALSEMLLAVEYYHDAAKEIVLIKPHASASIAPFLQKMQRVYLPNRILLVVTQGAEQARRKGLFPLVDKKKARQGKVTAYVCMRQVCELPTTDPAVFARQLRKVRPLPR